MKYSKVLIIGQAPPAVKQSVPYDTTLLYEMLEWVDITKEDAQNLFEFDAIYGEFPGFDENGGHKKPTQQQIEEYWVTTLSTKVTNAQSVLVLGNVAKDFIKSIEEVYPYKKFVYLIHPSKRNYSRIMESRSYITNQLYKIL